MSATLQRFWRRYAFLNRVAIFATGQGSIQLIQIVSGLLLLRWLDVREYAQYGLAAAFLATFRIFVEMGLPGAVAALVGDRFNDSNHVGRYVAAAKKLRFQLFLVFSAAFIVSFSLIAGRHRWPWPRIAELVVCILICIWLEGRLNINSRVLLARRRVAEYYGVLVLPGIARLAGLAFFRALSTLSSVTALWLNVFSTWLSARAMHNRSRRLIDEPTQPDRLALRELKLHVAPLAPSIVFFGLQGQIIIFIMGLVGKTQQIAEVAALGRLAQVFVLLGASNAVLVAPILAATPSSKLLRRYSIVLAIGSCAAGSITLIGALFPEPLLWLLGSNYAHLSRESSWIVAGACVRYLASLCSVVNRSRSWMSWRASVSTIVLELAAQVVAIFYLDVATTMEAVYFSVVAACAALFGQLLINIIGLANSPSRQSRPSASAT